jgi:hypothetical protein
MTELFGRGPFPDDVTLVKSWMWQDWMNRVLWPCALRRWWFYTVFPKKA